MQSELNRELSANPTARAAFDRLPASHRKEYEAWIAEGKKEDTRVRRAPTAIEMILEKANGSK